MSILSALAHAYERLPDAPPFGFSAEKIGFVIALNEDGTPAGVPSDVRSVQGKKHLPRIMQVPQSIKRASGIAPNFLWDKTSYVLGVTAGKGKRTANEHAAFVARHTEALAGSSDVGLRALLAFLEWWTPECFAERGWPEEMKDQNIVFTLEADRLQNIYLHDRPAAKALWARLLAGSEREQAICLVTGDKAPIARLHPAIKGVWGAQSSGASIVSFNLDSFTSYGHEQGDNAPVSEAAVFAYTTALNRFLAAGSKNRIQIGDASTVFWADASEAEVADVAEGVFAAMCMGIDEGMQAQKVGVLLEQIRQGKPLRSLDPKLEKGVRFHVLALAPNAARLSIRFWFDNDFGVLVEHYQAYANDMQFEPWPVNRPLPAIASCALRTAPARRDRTGKITFDKKQVSPLLLGELLRAILTGARFPTALLALLVMRVRNDHILDGIRIALIKSLIVRAMRIERRLPQRPDGTIMEDYLVRSDADDPNPARRLGRLFAVIERAQLAALGDEINATVKDKFLGAAAATPGRVFPGILTNARHHMKRLRNGHSDASWIKDAKHARRVGAALDRDIGHLWSFFTEGASAQHSSEEQGLFLVGYYQERYGAKASPDAGDVQESESGIITDDEEGS